MRWRAVSALAIVDPPYLGGRDRRRNGRHPRPLVAAIRLALGVIRGLAHLLLEFAGMFFHGTGRFFQLVARDLADGLLHGTLDLMLRAVHAIVIHALSPESLRDASVPLVMRLRSTGRDRVVRRMLRVRA